MFPKPGYQHNKQQTNNYAAELIAIVEALKYVKGQGTSEIVYIFTDKSSAQTLACPAHRGPLIHLIPSLCLTLSTPTVDPSSTSLGPNRLHV